MSDLVLLHHNEPMTTSLAIADGVELEHKTVIQLVRKYLEDLQKFGPCAFEMRMVERKQGGGRQAEVFFLNEGQSIFLLTLMRNSEIVVRFKLALVQAFISLRDRLQSPTPTLTTNPSHSADISVAADRTFRSFMRAARSAGMSLPAALRIANVKTVERTGIDMLAELDVDPDAPPARPLPVVEVLPDPFVEALVRWANDVAPGESYRMADILRTVSGIEPTSKAFQRQSPTTGRVLRRLGWGQIFTRAGGTCPHRFWVKK